MLVACTRERSAPEPQTIPATSLHARLRRLSAREYDNVVRDLLAIETHPSQRLPNEGYTNGYDNGSADLSVQPTHALAYQAAAESLAATAVDTRLYLVLDGCDPAFRDCTATFFDSFPARAYRRPPTANELARLRRVFESAGEFRLGVQTVLEAILQSPSFLYREELGSPRLDDYELASEISFFLTGSAPDRELRKAAASGAFDPREQALRLLATPAARVHLRWFFHQWLGTDRLALVKKDATLYPELDAALANDMTLEVDRILDAVVFDGSGTLAELFTTERTFATPRLAAIYAPTGERRGILTRPAWLTAHSGTDHSGPVTRGVFFRANFLCQDMPPPPRAALLKTIKPASPGTTTRDRFALHSDDPECRGCHQLIDGIGFGFEQFDALGRLRTIENGATVDTSGVVRGSMDLNGPFIGASELSVRLSKSSDLSRCFARHLYRFAMGTAETSDDQPVVDAIHATIGNDARILDALAALVASPAFRARRAEAP